MSSNMKKESEVEMFKLPNSSWARFYFKDQNKTIFSRNDKLYPQIKFEGYVTIDRFFELKAFL